MKFGISNNVRSRVVRECTPELFHRATRSKLVADVCAEIADGLERLRRGELAKEEYETLKASLKKRLPIFTPHATFRNGRRLNADAVPSGLSMYDVDHISNPRGYWEEKRAQLEAKGLMRYVVLAHITPSTEGLRLFFIIPAGMDLASAQQWMSAQLGDANYDISVKDYARSSFVVPEGYVLYLDEEGLFGNEELRMKNEESLGNEELRMKNEESLGNEELRMKNEESLRNEELRMKNEESPASGNNSSFGGVADILHSSFSGVRLFRGIPYASIIAQWFRLTGGEPVPGERNDKLHRLASHLRYITDNDEALMLQVMPRYGLSEEEMRGLIHSACSAEWFSMPRVMKEAVKNEELRMKNEESPADGKNSSFGGAADILHSSFPKCLPALVELLVSRTPDLYKAAVAHAVFPPLAAHLHRVSFRYIDNVEHEATLMNVLMAGTGAGKDCISEPINRIMADIRRRDAENLQREREWKNEVTSKAANKDKRLRPEGLIIQEIDADMTNPAFVMRMAEADGHFLYTKLNEIDQFDALKGSGRGGQQFQIMCLAFDPGNRYGQTRVGAQSVTEKVTIRFNWNASTTIQKGKRYFSKVLTDGPISRINFCTIPEREIGAEMPVYGTYDEAFDEALRPYIDNLLKAQGLIDCPQAYELARTLKEECAEFARLSQSRVYENLSFRANVIAWLKACVLYVANDCRWDDTFDDFIRWSLQYDLACKMEFFGAEIEATQATSGTRTAKGPRNLLELLPDNFTYQQAVQVRVRQGLDAEGTPNMLRQWKHRRYITVVTEEKFKKLKFRRNGTDTDKNR